MFSPTRLTKASAPMTAKPARWLLPPTPKARPATSAFEGSTWIPGARQAPEGDIAKSRFGGAMIYQDPRTGRSSFIKPATLRPLDLAGFEAARRAAEARAAARPAAVPAPGGLLGDFLRPAKRAAYLASRRAELNRRHVLRVENARREAAWRKFRLGHGPNPVLLDLLAVLAPGRLR